MELMDILGQAGLDPALLKKMLPMLDLNRDGNPLDDILGVASKLMR